MAKTVEELVQEVSTEIKTFKDNTAKDVSEHKTKLVEIETKLKSLDGLASNEALEQTKKSLQDQFDELATKFTEGGIGKGGQNKSFNDNLSESLTENEALIKSFAGQKGGDLRIALKAAGDMSYASNFSGTSAANITTDFRQSVLQLRESDLYLRNIIPGGTTNAASIWYPRHIGGEGEPAPWSSTAGTAKPVFDFDFDGVNDPVQWIAGIVHIPRQMLDDVEWLNSFLRANMLKKLYQAENKQILNGTGVSPQLRGLIPQAEAYDGTKTITVEKIVDAAYGQVVDNESVPSHVILNSRDAVDIALNKAVGSGEYDLPPGTVGFVNGRLTISGLTVIPVNSRIMARGNFLVGDFSATQFVTRLAPELRFFEQNKDDVEKNMITARIEERAVLATFYPDAFVKGTF